MKLLNNHEQRASNFTSSPKINPEFFFIKLITGYRVILLCVPFSHWFYQDFCNNYEKFSLIFLSLTELPDVIREMRKEQALYKSKKNTTKGGQRENQVRVSTMLIYSARLISMVRVENFSQTPSIHFANP